MNLTLFLSFFFLCSVTGIKAFMTGKVKVKGDLLLAQRLEEAVEKMGAREVGIKEKDM
jgi:putative sterol carrier protein